ncbi:MAG TPA: PilZ domain-containing protein [Syntrophobacteraceae bacterium]|nr:PilZ domain-containing protein [Syntrophobacteraceae bacterium]
MSEQESITREVLTDRRLPCQVTFESGESIFRGTSMHFSEKGMLVMCKHPARLNARGRISLSFPGLNRPVELTGEVVWTNMYGVGDSLSPKGMGIRFINAERETERLLSELAAQYESLGSIYTCYYT